MPDLSIVDRAFLMLLWREPGERERRETARAIEAGQSVAELVSRIIASSEFRLVFEGLSDGVVDVLRPTRELNSALERLGSHDEFIARAYELILGRPADPSGGTYYVQQLERGMLRTMCLKTLLLSDEFAVRLKALSPEHGFVPRDIQLCELANPAKWENPDWRALLKSLQVVPADRLSMHRKGYEFTQLLFGLSQLEALQPGARVLSVGAGHEPVLYWLANRVGTVIATDMYGGVWQQAGAQEGDERVFESPEDFAPFPYRTERLLFLRMDGRALAFRDDSFDIVYSLSSIEHFGGYEGARECVAEMARILRPGGVLALATEYCLSGPPHHEAFQPAEVHRLLAHRRLRLVQPIDESVWRRYQYVPVDLRVNPYQAPHMVVRDGESIFTSVMAFLRKQNGVQNEGPV